MFSLIVTLIAVAVITALALLAVYVQATVTVQSTPWAPVAIAAWAICYVADRFIKSQKR